MSKSTKPKSHSPQSLQLSSKLQISVTSHPPPIFPSSPYPLFLRTCDDWTLACGIIWAAAGPPTPRAGPAKPSRNFVREGKGKEKGRREKRKLKPIGAEPGATATPRPTAVTRPGPPGTVRSFFPLSCSVRWGFFGERVGRGDFVS